ncbi:MAG: hypothetical protein R6V74_03325 [Lutibacter sp.]
MKAIKFILFGIGLIFASEAQAQISVKLNADLAPQWGPANYSNARYYYLPDVETYYDIEKSRFVYPSGNTWYSSEQLPQRYKDYDLYNGYKVAMTDHNGKPPYGLFKFHKVKYAKGYKGKSQKTIGPKPGNRYGTYKDKGDEKMKSNGHDNGNQKSNGNDKGNQKSKDNGNGKKQ